MRRIVVTGGAGFIGSHLCEALINKNYEVTCVDDFSTGTADNVSALREHPAFRLIEHDVTDGLMSLPGEQYDIVAHLASPASPADYLARPLETLAVGSRGTEAALELADAYGARFIFASTSEVYGDPLVHPQTEEYWGNVNPIGPRSVYDESKRFGEALVMAYHRERRVRSGIVRIFNTYGPRLRSGDGRVVSNFIVQALHHKAITVYGDGAQTRSFCYVDDTVRGLILMIEGDDVGPINLGSPVETRIVELADRVGALCKSSASHVYLPLPTDDPRQRRPDISAARRLLRWEPRVELSRGLAATMRWFERQLGLEPG